MQRQSTHVVCVLGQTVNAAAREGLRRRLRVAVLAPWSLDTFVTSSAINTYMYIWLIHVQVPTATGASYLSPSAQPAGEVQVPTSFRDLSRRCGAPGHSEFGICPMILYVSHSPTLSLIQPYYRNAYSTVRLYRLSSTSCITSYLSSWVRELTHRCY